MKLSNISATDIKPVTKELVVKKFTGSNNMDYLLTKGINAKYPNNDEIIILSLWSKDTLKDDYEKIAMKVESPTQGYIEWLDFKKDERTVLYRDPVETVNNKKTWTLAEMYMDLKSISAIFERRIDGIIPSQFDFLRKGYFSCKDLTPKEKRAIRLLNQDF